MLSNSLCRVACLALGALALSASMARATVLWNEAGNGDLSNSQSAPTSLILLPGANSLVGSVGTGDQQDWIALTVPAGFQLTSDVQAAYSSTDAQGFTGFQAGPSFVGNPETTPSAYQGYAHFGTGATNGASGPANLLGTDLLPIMAVAPGAQGFTTPLPAGTYTFLIQQLGATTGYQFDFAVAPAPEPGAAGLMAIGAATLLLRRLNRKSR
jgi:hypothetical protein